MARKNQTGGRWPRPWQPWVKGLSLALCITSGWQSVALAEGSRDMYPASSPAGADRGHIEWTNNTSGGVRRRTLLRVYAEAGEYILLGSSAIGVSANGGVGDIVVYDPGTVTGPVADENLPTTPNFVCSVDRPGTGFIGTRAEELTGPESIDGSGNTAGYTPCWYQATTTGMYYVAMYGPSGPNTNGQGSNSPNAGAQLPVGSIRTDSTQKAAVSAWDVTVRDSQSSTTDRLGRLHTFYIALNMGSNGRQLHADLYPITMDGYRYEIDIQGLDPFGFRLFGNQLGNLDSDGVTPLYRDVLGTNGGINNPAGGTSTAPPQYPIFFNPLDGAVLSSIPVYDPISGLQTGSGFPASPVLPVVSSPAYTGNVSTGTSTVSDGGTFSFGSNLPSGIYQIVISRDGTDFDPGNPLNRVLRGYMSSSGAQTASWNGLDNTGQPFPVGFYDYSVETHGGEYHFPISDAENNFTGGPAYTLLNATNPLGNTTAFYDHRGYYTIDGTLVPDRDPGDGDPLDDALCGSGPPNPPATNLITGADSTAPGFNTFGQASGGNTNTQCTGAYGDTKTLDLWTYFPSAPNRQTLVIVDVDYDDLPDAGVGNGPGDYSTLSSDNGPSHVVDGTLSLGSGVTSDQDGFVDGVDDSGNGTDDADDALTSLPNATSGSAYSLANIPVNNAGTADATLHAWIDFNQDGQFDASEYQSATVAPGTTTVSLNWTVPSGAVPGNTYARFRLTSDTLTDDSDTAGIDERSIGPASNGEVEGYGLTIDPAPADPIVLLVKRITALNEGATTFGGDDLSVYLDQPDAVNPYDDNNITVTGGGNPGDPPRDTDQWPNITTNLVGGVDGGNVVANDEIEYTIYFLSAGDTTAENVRFCDYVPLDTAFLPNSFNGNSPATGGIPGADLGIEVFQGGVAAFYTGAIDGDGAVYFPPGTDPANDSRFANIDCEGDGNSANANPNGAIAVDLGDILNASSATTVANDSYGYVRFRARVQ